MAAKIKSPPRHTKTSHRHKPKGLSDKKFERVYWPYIPIILIAGLLLLFNIKNGTLATIIHHPASRVLGYATSMSADTLLADTNAARTDSNQQPLHLNNYLSQAAQAKANDMARQDYWSHNTPSGNPPWIFVQAQGYKYQKLGENLATGFADAQSTISGWMASTEHRQNMLDSAYSEVGFGYANIANYTAAGGGPMTIIVAFYGQPLGVSDAANSTLVGTTTSNLPKETVVTTRADLAFAKSPISGHAQIATLCALMLVIGLWAGRHLLTLRRVLVGGEAFIVTHPLLDASLILLGVGFFALTRAAGFIQ